MDDSLIVELYLRRDEAAITESRKKYGQYCGAIARNILRSAEDADECVSDTLLGAWNNIPPDRPVRLSVYLGRITRNLALDRYRRDRSGKRGGGQAALCLDELAECVGENGRFEDRLGLKDLIEDFLRGLPVKNKDIFMMRYWYFFAIDEIAKRYGTTPGAVKTLLGRLRKKLREYLERNGVEI